MNLGQHLEFHDHETLPRHDVIAKRFKDLRKAQKKEREECPVKSIWKQ